MPNKLRILGIIFLTFGIILLILKYKFNYKPEFLNLKVFALYSFYIEAKTFSMITHQMIADIAGIFLITGLFILSFTKEKNESDEIDSLRLKAFILAAYVNLFYIISSILFFWFWLCWSTYPLFGHLDSHLFSNIQVVAISEKQSKI